MAAVKGSQAAGDVFIAENATVTGDVVLSPGASVWYGAVLRGDEARIEVGERTNIQDNAVLHGRVRLGAGTTVGHGAIVHGCTVGNNTIVGMGSIVLDGAVVGDDCIIGAGALVTGGARIPDGSLAFGSPARVIRSLTEDEIAANRANAQEYVRLAREALTAR